MRGGNGGVGLENDDDIRTHARIHKKNIRRVPSVKPLPTDPNRLTLTLSAHSVRFSSQACSSSRRADIRCLALE